MTNLEKAMEDKEKILQLLIENKCPVDFGLKNGCINFAGTPGKCETCWNQPIEE